MKPYALSLLLLPLGACASIIEGSSQQINLQTNPPLHADCRLSNERGAWQTSAPAVVTVKRSKSDLNVECRSSGISGQAVSGAEPEGWTFGNIVTGFLGAGVDGATGAMFAYDTIVTVPLASSEQPVSSFYPAPSAAPAITTHSLAPATPARATAEDHLATHLAHADYPDAAHPATHPLRQGVTPYQRAATKPASTPNQTVAAATPAPASATAAPMLTTARVVAPNFTLPQPATRPAASQTAATQTVTTADPYARVDNAYSVAAPDVADYTNDDSRLTDLTPAAGPATASFTSAQAQPSGTVRPMLLPLPTSR